MEFIKRITKAVSSSSLKEMNKIMYDEPSQFMTFINANEIQLDDFIDHVFEAYVEGGLVAAS